MGVGVVSMVMPLTILLSSIMTFGEFGERYELAAMKAAGIPLSRIMRPLFVVSTILAIILFFFSNNIIPDFQRKAKNMLYNIVATKPALNFTSGQFIDRISGYSVKFDKIYGENGKLLDGVTVHKTANSYQNQQTIVAKSGKFVPAADKNFLKLVLYNGFIYEDELENKNFQERLKNPDQAIKFDTLVTHFDISELINKAIESERITDDYRFQTYGEINGRISQMKKDNDVRFTSMSNDMVSQTNNYVSYIDKSKTKQKIVPQVFLEKQKKDKKLEILYNAYNKIETLKNSTNFYEKEMADIVKYNSQVIMYQQRIFAYSITCIIFFMIGSSLGSIVRKGGFGLPVVIAIFIFIVFYILNLTVENLSWKGRLDPYLAAWLPNIVLFPFAIWLSFKALTDSQLFDLEKYRKLIKPITSLFTKTKEHARYQ